MTKTTSNSYVGAPIDPPAFHIFFARLLPATRPFFDALFNIRNRMSQPLQIRVMPKWLPLIPGLSAVSFVTYGQVMLALPLLLLVVAGVVTTFVEPAIGLSGHIAAIAIILAFLTANKSNSFFSLLFGIPFERMIPFHNMASLTAIVLGGFHAYAAYSEGDDDDEGSNDRRLSEDSAYALSGTNPNLIKFLFDGGTNITGTGIIICMVVLVATSFFSILRRWFFEFWLFTHIFTAMAVIGFCLAHSALTIIFVAIWWAVDVFFRYIIMLHYLYPNKASLEMVLDDVVEVRFPKTPQFEYKAGQFVQICFPSITPLQFHPVTISSAPHEDFVTLHIRSLGNWSQQLTKLATEDKETKILLEGPYGSLTMDLDNDRKYQMILTVGGGIGVTPCQSIARNILQQYHQGRQLRKLQFVWAVRKLDMALAMPPPRVIDCAKVVGDSEVSTNVEGNSNVLLTNVYLTKPDDSCEETLAGCDAPFNLVEGRPDFDSIFQGLKKDAKEQNLARVAVIGCGPKPMMDQLRAACRNFSDSEQDHEGVKFDLHEEFFNF